MVSLSEVLVGVLVALGIALFATAFFSIGKIGAAQINSGSVALASTPQNFQKFVSAELPDKCKTPPGYSDADWKEHLGHHPDRYAECLQ